MPFPPPPQSTHDLNQVIVAAGDLSRPSNSKWEGVTRWLAASAGLATEEVYPVYISKPGNFKVRFDQGAKRCRLGLGVLKNHEELDACVRGARRICGPTSMYGAIALCSRPGRGPWTITALIHGGGDQLAPAIRTAFPGADAYEYVGQAVEVAPDGDMDRLADELYVDRDWLRNVIWLLRDKRGLVFYGPPGTGKTFIAKRIAAFLQSNPKLRALVQLHPSYGYEDFFEGWRPVASKAGGLALDRMAGPLRLLHDAARLAKQDAFLVLDEMNRANLPKVFGELFFALEYRDEPVRLMYDPTEEFVLGRELHVIGTMNTADRSIAVLDQALRRRFHFVGLFPGSPIVDGIFERFLIDKHPNMRWMSDVLERANKLLGDPNIAIGPSHFMRSDLDEELAARVWRHSVTPTVEEHFFGDQGRLSEFHLEALRAAVEKSREEDNED